MIRKCLAAWIGATWLLVCAPPAGADDSETAASENAPPSRTQKAMGLVRNLTTFR